MLLNNNLALRCSGSDALHVGGRCALLCTPPTPGESQVIPCHLPFLFIYFKPGQALGPPDQCNAVGCFAFCFLSQAATQSFSSAVFFFKESTPQSAFTSSLPCKFHYSLKLYILTAQMGWAVITSAACLLEHTAYFNCGVDNFEELGSQ